LSNTYLLPVDSVEGVLLVDAVLVDDVAVFVEVDDGVELELVETVLVELLKIARNWTFFG
jgi:hypothetical protein